MGIREQARQHYEVVNDAGDPAPRETGGIIQVMSRLESLVRDQFKVIEEHEMALKWILIKAPGENESAPSDGNISSELVEKLCSYCDILELNTKALISLSRRIDL